MSQTGEKIKRLNKYLRKRSASNVFLRVWVSLALRVCSEKYHTYAADCASISPVRAARRPLRKSTARQRPLISPRQATPLGNEPIFYTRLRLALRSISPTPKRRRNDPSQSRADLALTPTRNRTRMRPLNRHARARQPTDIMCFRHL